MVKLNKIYTKTGDSGFTSIVGGERVSKNSLRIIAVGSVDETNSAIGVALTSSSSYIKEILTKIQNDLFDLGADISTPIKNKDDQALRIVEEQVLQIEKKIDEINLKLKDLESFVLPGGSLTAANIHLSRSICRRAELNILALSEINKINPFALSFINRLSDLLFVIARHENNAGKEDILWKPGSSQNL